MKLLRLLSHYGYSAVAILVQVVLLPINLSILGLHAWALFGLLGILKTVVARLDGGVQVLVQVEAAGHKNCQRLDRFYLEVLMLSIPIALTIVLCAMQFINYNSDLNDAFGRAVQTETALAIVLCAVLAGLVRISEANLIGHSREPAMNFLRVVNLLATASCPFVVMVLFLGSLRDLFACLLVVESLHFLTILVLSIDRKRVMKTKNIRAIFSLHEVRNNAQAMLSAFAYQGVAFVSVGADIILFGFIMGDQGYSLLILIIAIKNAINSVIRPVTQFTTQEIYSNNGRSHARLFDVSITSITIFCYVIFFLIHEVLGFWISNQELLLVKTEVFLVVSAAIFVLCLTTVIAKLNYERKFKSRTMAYLVSGAVFYLLIFRSLHLTGDLNITDAAIALAVREFVLIFAVAAQVKLLKVIFLPLLSCVLYLGISSFVHQLFPVVGLIMAGVGLGITIYYYRDDISWMWLRGKNYL